MEYSSLAELRGSLAPNIVLADGTVRIGDPESFRQKDVDRLVFSAVFGDEEVRKACRWIIWEASRALGALPSSIQQLYEAAGRGEYSHVTVPAMNLRGMTYDMARAIFRVAMRNNCRAFVFEIARSEMDYTKQQPAEFSSAVLAAAMREGYRGPVFMQGDHFQFNANRYAEGPDRERDLLKALIRRAIEAGFFNIDIDASTLVDLSLPTLEEQQRVNCELTAEMARVCREVQPEGVTVSIGGEIGEVGGQNSTVEDLRTFMNGFRQALPDDLTGLSKVSVQTGTVHGGIPLPDGRVAMVSLDFDVLRDLSRVAREEYSLAGAVQHGASTLPEEFFHKFPEVGTAEVHLATGFQNIIFESKAFPVELKERIYAYLKDARAEEWKAGMSDEQFYYTTRKRAWGQFKRETWTLPADAKAQISAELEAQFDLLFHKLGVVNSADLVDRFVKPVPVPKTPLIEI